MYLLDTNTVIYHFKGLGRVSEHLLSVAVDELLLPSLVIFELQVGVAKAGSPAKRLNQLEQFINAIHEVPFGKQEALCAASVRADLEQQGMPIGCIDVLIAGMALAHQATLVTHNISEFSRVKGLNIVDWY